VIKEHPDRGEMLLDGRLRSWMRFDVRRDGDGFDLETVDNGLWVS